MITQSLDLNMFRGVQHIRILYHGDQCLDGYCSGYLMSKFLFTTIPHRTDNNINRNEFFEMKVADAMFQNRKVKGSTNWRMATSLIRDVIPLPSNYKDCIPGKYAGNTLYILVDFSWSDEQIRQVVNRGDKICIIDHHKDRVEIARSWIEADLIYGLVSTDYCGAVLTAFAIEQLSRLQSGKHNLNVDMLAVTVFPETGIRKELDYLRFVNSRDLWKKNVEGTDEVVAYMMLQIQNSLSTSRLNQSIRPLDQVFREFERIKDWNSVIETGRLLLMQRKLIIQSEIKKYFKFTFVSVATPETSGTYFEVACVALPREFRSDAAQALYEFLGTNVAANVTIRIENFHAVMDVSLRSTKEVDVNEIAKKFGGGGHPTAAGFEYSIPLVNFKGRGIS